MPSENRTDPRKNFVPRFLPWLLAVAAFLVYYLTLNHWVSVFNLAAVAKISGWTWQLEFTNPILFLVTWPFRWLAPGQIPIALNLFSAACAALTLGLLARSVAILPQDRTDAQRARERSVFSFLTIWSAWLPPVLAVAVCGLQLTFWEQATNHTGEMFELLLFAFVIWSLLEYRLDEREWRLFLAAFVYGAGMADGWSLQSLNGSALIGFFPLFVAAIIWIRKLSFFNARFLQRMLLCGLAGILFYFFLPLLAVGSHKMPVTFWGALKVNLGTQWYVVKLFFTQGHVRSTVGLLSLTSLLPLFLLSIRWPSSFGDNSKLGLALTSFVFHLIHAIFLGLCLWVAFDPQFSPRHLGLGLPFLTFYYLGALSIGYFSGYFLLVFGKTALDRSKRLEPSPFEALGPFASLGVFTLAIVTVIGLIYKNIPEILKTNDDTFKKYAALVEENLPRSGCILLCDDPRRLFIVQAALAREGRAKDFVLVDTASLPFPRYHRFLNEKFSRWPDTVRAFEQTNGISALHLIGLLATLAKSNQLYYLHPSFGYYFEEFYLEPHGLVYKLKTLPADTLLPPLPDKNEIAENEIFWEHASKDAFPPIEAALRPSDPAAQKSLGEKIFTRLHIKPIEPEINPVLATAGTFYSRGLDFWGVQLQRAGELEKASTQFQTALKLNPNNVVAQINLQFNQRLRAGQPTPVDLSKTTSDQFSQYRSLIEVINDNGPFDEPSFCFENGVTYIRGRLLRQALASFTRVHQFAPDNFSVRLTLGELYVACRLPDRALDALNELLKAPEKFPLDETNSTQINMLMAAAYFQKNENQPAARILQTEITRHPNNENLLVATAQAYMVHGLFTNALVIIDRRLKSTPDDPNWLYGRGYVRLQLKNFEGAAADMSRVIALQTTNDNAIFNRAVAYLESGKLDAARADYEKLSSFTNSFQIAYGLGEIAWRKHETNSAIKNYQAYLAIANTNTAEARTVFERLHQLQK